MPENADAIARRADELVAAEMGISVADVHEIQRKALDSFTEFAKFTKSAKLTEEERAEALDVVRIQQGHIRADSTPEDRALIEAVNAELPGWAIMFRGMPAQPSKDQAAAQRRLSKKLDEIATLLAPRGPLSANDGNLAVTLPHETRMLLLHLREYGFRHAAVIRQYAERTASFEHFGPAAQAQRRSEPRSEALLEIARSLVEHWRNVRGTPLTEAGARAALIRLFKLVLAKVGAPTENPDRLVDAALQHCLRRRQATHP